MKAKLLFLGLLLIASAAKSNSVPAPMKSQEVFEIEHELLGTCTIGQYGEEDPVKRVVMICDREIFLYEVSR